MSIILHNFRFVALLLGELYHKTMNKSTSFQSVGGIVFYGIPLRCSPAFLAVWGGQAEKEAVISTNNPRKVL